MGGTITLRRIGLFLLSFNLVHCGYPGKDLNPIEKQAELEWVFATFERNYAPAEWKASKHGKSVSEIKTECAEKAKDISRGDEFIALLSQCVSRFQDAHTKIIAGGQALPEMITVAYLGFRTEFVKFDPANQNKKNGSSTAPTDKLTIQFAEPPAVVPAPANIVYGLKVTNLLATTLDTNFPLQTNDIITKINSQDVKDYLLDKLVPFQNLGNELSSLVVAGQVFPLRDSTFGSLPQEESVSLEFFRNGIAYNASLPWNHKDLFAFANEQTLAEKAKKSANAPKEDKKSVAPENPNRAFSGPFWTGTEFIDQALALFSQYRQTGRSRVGLLLTETFRLQAYNPVQGLLARLDQEAEVSAPSVTTVDPIDLVLGETRFDVSLPPFAARVFLDENNQRFGFIRIESFNVGDAELKTFRRLITKMNQMKVQGLIIDLLNNGGGSLVHGLAMVNALTDKALDMPKLQVALNDHWINGFKTDSIYAPSDAQRTFAQRVLKQIESDIASHLRISRPISATELAPFILQIDKKNCVNDNTCLKKDTKLVLLVNEMCASMCDIFAGVFRDNKLGTIIGAQTMGAGGNVVLHGFSPVTQVGLTQTESLVVDSQGQYLENQGVIPDEVVDTIFDKSNLYSETYGKAVKMLK